MVAGCGVLRSAEWKNSGQHYLDVKQLGFVFDLIVGIVQLWMPVLLVHPLYFSQYLQWSLTLV